MPCHRTYDQRIPGVGDASQRGDRGEIDEIGRLGETKLQGWDESHPAGDDFGFLVGTKQACDLIEARWLVIVEFIHRSSPYFRCYRRALTRFSSLVVPGPVPGRPRRLPRPSRHARSRGRRQSARLRWDLGMDADDRLEPMG